MGEPLIVFEIEDVPFWFVVCPLAVAPGGTNIHCEKPRAIAGEAPVWKVSGVDVQLFDPWSEIGGLEWLEVVFVVLE